VQRPDHQDVPVIVVNGGHKGERQRFTLAHDLAHLVLRFNGLSDADQEKAAGQQPENASFRLPKVKTVRPGETKDPEKIAYLDSRQLLDLATWFETDDEFMSMHRRIILPFTYENRLVGYTGRFFGPAEDEKKYGKYKKKSPANYVYGLDAQREQRQYVIVCEGEFDALLTSGLAIGSNNINDKQIQLIEDLNIEPIVIPDQDKAGRDLAEQAANCGWSVSFPEWEDCKDVGDAVKKYGRMFTVHSILQAAEHSPTKIRLLARRLGV
jgi:DNA primase